MLPFRVGLLSVNEVAILILTLAPPFTGGHSPSTFEDDKTIGGDGDDMNIDDDDDKTIDGDGDDKKIGGEGDDMTIGGDGDDKTIGGGEW